jgi:hypothetical protein
MDTARDLVRLAHRQANDQQCLIDQKTAFTSQQVLLQTCLPTDDACLCAQQGPNAFSGWYLNAVCGTCDVNAQEGAAVDPLSALGQLCPEQASIFQASSYTCSNFTPPPTQTTEPPAAGTNLSQSTARVVSPGIPTSSSDISSSIISPTVTITPTMVPGSFPSQTPVSSFNTTETLPPSTTIFVPATPTSVLPVLSTSRQNNGLSTGAKAGIGVAAAVAFIILILALIFLFCRRRKTKAGWTSTGVNTRELYPEDGVNSAYALNGGHTESPIGTAITTENKAHLGADGFVPAVRDIYLDDEQVESPNSDGRPPSDDRGVIPLPPDSRRNTQSSFHDLPSPLPKTYPVGAITRKDVATPSPPPAYPATLPRTMYASSPTQSRAGSRMSGVLRGPVPDMYAFGGETIENDEELERLEEEERRIDEAIQESERVRRMREERRQD